MLAVRSNERAAAAAASACATSSWPPSALGSFIAGVAGAMYAYNFGSISADRFSALTALGLIAFAYVGGITMVSGAIFAGLIATEALFPHALDIWFGLSGTWALLLGGIFLIFNLIFYPEGVAGASYKKKMARRKAEAAGTARPSRLRTLLQVPPGDPTALSIESEPACRSASPHGPSRCAT